MVHPDSDRSGAGAPSGSSTVRPDDGNLAELVDQAAARGADHLALIDLASGRTLSWGQVRAAVLAEAARLVTAGVTPGDRVAIRLPTSPEFWIALFAAVRIGAVAVPLAPRSTAIELDRVLALCEPTVLIQRPDAPGDGSGAVRLLDPPASDGVVEGATDPVGGGEDLAVLAFTSGTSGGPRGVMLSHRALLSNLEQCAALRPPPVSAADRVLLALPLFHSYGLGPGVLQVTHAGATAVLADRFDPQATLDAIAAHRVTAVVGVPPMYRAWLRLGAQRLGTAMRTVRMLTSGAAPLEPALMRDLQAITGVPLHEGYGLTESGPVLTTTLVDGRPIAGSVGRPLPGGPGVDPVELRLVDVLGHPLPMPVADGGDDTYDEDAGGTGFVAVRGPNLFSGYWPDATGGPGELPELGAGWFRTGDVGYLDSTGALRLVDRADDLIIVSGFNVYPHEVEEALLEHPAVAEAAAVGVPDERTGEAVRVVVVPAEGGALEPGELIRHCAVRLARFKVPVQVSVVEALPYSATGKLARRELREVSMADAGDQQSRRGADDTDDDLF